MMKCPCGTGKSFADCCEAFITGAKLPATPEELMRSRYSAYHQRQFNYIMNTMKPPAANHFDMDDAKKSAEQIRWTRLEVIKAMDDTVEFRAHYRAGSNHYVLHEISKFVCDDGKWFYIDGIQD